jgi:membrane dipeptidase
VIADAHNDLLLELVIRRNEPSPFAVHWLPKLRAGGVGLQICALFTGHEPGAPQRADDLLAAFGRLLDENGDDVVHVRDRDDLGGDDRRIRLVLSLEGVEALDGDPAKFARFWDAGVRIVGLTHNVPNAFAGGIDAPDQGLTPAGRALVDELAERGAIIDLSHASERTFSEILEHAPEANVIVSHACCRALHDIPRNVSDEQLRVLADREGFLGIMALALIVGPEPTIERFVDHVDHAVGVMGGKRVGLGTDVIDQVTDAELEHGIEPHPMVGQAREAGGGRSGLRDFTGPEHFPALVAALAARGFGDAIQRDNLIHVLQRGLPRRS